jgi:hypothetical protein
MPPGTPATGPAAPKGDPAAVAFAHEQYDELESIAERVTSRTSKANDFFDSVITKFKSILETVDRTQMVTPAQQTALENMLAGAKKWDHGDR